MTSTEKPTVYIASPYTKGDVAINAHFQCKVFDQLLNDQRVLPVAPLWSHFQHVLFPRPYEEWVRYDQEMLHLYDCCLRLNAELPALDYLESDSRGADAEVETFLRLGKPVFYSVAGLYTWLDSGRSNAK